MISTPIKPRGAANSCQACVAHTEPLSHSCGCRIINWVRTSAILSFFTLYLSFPAHAQNLATQRGGVFFRVDDDHPLWQWQEYVSLFDRYDLKCCLALNMTWLVADQNALELFRRIQSQGHELMDHTPDHATHYFTGVADTAYYSGRAGVDHISGNALGDGRDLMSRVYIQLRKDKVSEIESQGLK